MAKITANGAHEIARFKQPETGTQYLVRSDAVVLTKYAVEGSGWIVAPVFGFYRRSWIKKGMTVEECAAKMVTWIEQMHQHVGGVQAMQRGVR